jgi:hypothetical protein
MKFKNLLLAGLCLLGFTSFGQVTTPQVVPNYLPRLCSNSQGKIPVQILGKFNDNNRFFVELMSYPDFNKSLATYEAVIKDGNLVFDIGGDVAQTYNEIYFRISTTSPATKTNPISTNWFTRGQISMSRPTGDSDTLNAGMSYLLNVDLDANNPVTITLSDSSVHEIRSTGYQQSISLIASKPTEIFIVKAVNTCDVPVPFSGKTPVVINPISIIPVRVNNLTALCEGNDIELSYAVSGGAIPESATFRLRFFKPYANENEKRIIEVSATRKGDGVLVARIPEKIVLYNNSFYVAVLVGKPGLVSSYLKSVNIYQKPTASFRSQSEFARIGEAFQMWLDVSGPEPYTVELNNGVSYALDGNRNIDVYPIKTETFSIRSLRTACGVTTELPKQTVVATVPAGIAINAPADQKWNICENQKLRLPFVTNAVLTANTKFTVEGTTYNNTSYQFEAKLVNDSIEFLIPHSPAEWIAEGYFNIKGFRIKASDPSLISQYNYNFNVRGIPRVSYQTPLPTTLTGAQYYQYALNVSGGTPYNVIDDLGEKSSAEYTPMGQTIFVPTTGAYGPKSVQNGCFSNSDLAKLNLTVNPQTGQTPAIVVHPPSRKYLCDPDSVEVYFEALGKFEEGNEFQIARWDNPENPWLTVSKPGRYKIPAALMSAPGYNNIQVRSTRPVVQASAAIPVIIDTKPALMYPGELSGTPQNPRFFGIDDIPYISTPLTGISPYSAEFTDGQKDYHFEQQLQYDTFRPSLPKSKVTAYTLKSISNACGTTNFNITTYLYWIGYTLSMKYFQEDKTYCAGQEMTVPFKVERGSAPAGTTYHLQISKGAIQFTTVASKTTFEDFRYTVPDTMVGEYFVRVIGDGGIDSGGRRFFVNKPPSASVSLSSLSSPEIGYGQSVYINYNLTGGGPWEMILNGQGNVTATYSPFTQSYTLAKGTAFEIRSVSNQCGYGSVSGSVTVKVKPRIITFQPEKTIVCSSESIRVKYQVGGDIPLGEKIGFYLKNPNGTRFELNSVTALMGTVSLPIPATLPGDSYELVCYITGSDISESSHLGVYKTPDIELTGNTTINAGESALLMVRSGGTGNAPLDVTLSDGTKSSISFWTPSTYYYIVVTPAATTTYTIASATGSCGAAKSTGSVTVTVNPPSARTVRITGSNKLYLFCEKDTLAVYYSLTGTFSANNQFTVQFYDRQGKLVNSLPVTSKDSPARVIVPAGFSATESYHIRLAASDASTASGDYQQAMIFGTKAGASFASNSATLDETGNAKVAVKLTGTGPWQYSYGNDLGAIQRYASLAPDTLLITSKEPSAYFRLLSVSNGCGTGTISEPSVIRLEIVLGTEDPTQAAELSTFGPNPTSGKMMLHFKTDSKRALTLYNASGILVWATHISGTITEVDMHQYPSGSYLLKIEHSKGGQSLRIVKE